MLKQPRSQDICCYFWEDAPLLGVLFTRRVVVITSVGAVAAAYTRVASVTWKQKKNKRHRVRRVFREEGGGEEEDMNSAGAHPLFSSHRMKLLGLCYRWLQASKPAGEV